MEDLLRTLAPQVLGALARRDGDFDACEDAVQEALLDAANQWPGEGLPRNPRGWLQTVAWRRLVEARRAEIARRRREEDLFAESARAAPDAATERDDTLTLMLLCCHPALTEPSQVALTLRAVGGLTTTEIARAFLVPEATIGQRISRAKQRIKESGARFELPTTDERPARVAALLRVLYLIFNEGYTATSGERLIRADLSVEAIRLARELHGLLPDDGEAQGLLALMLLTDARRDARTAADGALIPLDEQDRSRWNRDQIDEGVALVTDALRRAPIGPFQLQAAIAAVHDEAPSAAETDWPEILVLYGLLATVSPSPIVELNRLVAFAMVEGPERGLERLAVFERQAALERTGPIAGHRVAAVKGHLLEMAGRGDEAVSEYRRAARATANLPEQRYLEGRARRLEARAAAR